LAERGDIPALLLGLWQSGIEAVHPAHCLPPHLPRDRPAGRQVLFALGKAAATMAAVAVQEIEFDAGLIIAPHGSACPPAPPGVPEHAWTRLTAGHPEPDEYSLAAGREALAFVEALSPEDRLVALISGGGSALMVAPRPGLSLADKIATTRRLLASGAPISAINRQRAAMSLVKAGGLARASGTRDIRTIVMSDVPGDDPALVASGPTILSRSEPRATVCADAAMMLSAIAVAAEAAGLEVCNLGGAIEGNAVAIAREHGRMALATRPGSKPLLIISGGELTVTVRWPMERGGRNLTYALALAEAIDGRSDIFALAADSDGIDGNSPAAGAIIDGDSAAALRSLKREPSAELERNRSFAALAAIGAVFTTGPTGVNVNDLRLIYVGGHRART
jgi:glycerate 2-kinase